MKTDRVRPGGWEPRLSADGREWVLAEGEHLLGRDENVAVRIEAGGVSRQHARVSVRAGRATLDDLGSKNGTFCGDDRIVSPRLLKDGDVIRLGRRVTLVFHQQAVDETESELPLAAAAAAIFRREGEVWTVAFEGQAVRLTDVKGFPDLTRLLAQPGIEVHCLELAERPAESAEPDAILDERARRELQARARELRSEIEDADVRHDLGRGEQARAELEQIIETLSGALGLHGRPRSLGTHAERARSAVTWRIRSAIRKIASVHPRLGRHLENAVRTGTFCVYVPEAPVAWLL